MHTFKLDEDRTEDLGCRLQVGVSSWDKDHENEGRHKSVRAYVLNKVGGFNHDGSPETPIGWLLPLVVAALDSGIATLQTTDGLEVPRELALSVLASLQVIPDDSPTQHADGTPL
jgi:hypothetical protein